MKYKKNKLEEMTGIWKKKNMALEIMFFKKWAEHGFLQSQARNHRKAQIERMRNTAHQECFIEAHWESRHSVPHQRQ